MATTSTLPAATGDGQLTFGRGAWGVRAIAGSRLSFTLIDLNGECGRRNGMASMLLRNPSFQGVVRPAERPGVADDDGRAKHVEAIEEFLGALSDRWGT